MVQIEWSRNESVMSNSSRLIVSDTTITGAQTVTFPQVQPMDNGNYNCTVNIIGFMNFNVIAVNGKYL